MKSLVERVNGSLQQACLYDPTAWQLLRVKWPLLTDEEWLVFVAENLLEAKADAIRRLKDYRMEQQPFVVISEAKMREWQEGIGENVDAFKESVQSIAPGDEDAEEG